MGAGVLGLAAAAVPTLGAAPAQAAASGTADALLAAAASQLGYHAAPGTTSKYGAWYGIPAGAWCAMFVSWCAAQSGTAGVIPKHAYTPSGVAWFKAQGRWSGGTSGARRGDIVYFDWPDQLLRVQHVGIVETVNANGTLTTIEGNTSSSSSGSQGNGGYVARKVRSASIVGYGRPDYAAAPSSPTPPVLDTPEEELMRILVHTEKGIWLVGPGYAHCFNPEEWGQFAQYNPGIPVTQFPDGDAGKRVFDLHIASYTQRTV